MFFSLGVTLSYCGAQVEPSPQTTLLSGLEKYTWYEIWLSASTALGDGNQTSETVRVQTMEDGEWSVSW